MDSPSQTQSNNIHTIVKAQIVFLLHTLTEENYEKNQQEIRTLSEQYDTYLHFIRRVLHHAQPRLAPNATSPYDTASALGFRLLVQETQRLAHDPFLADRFRDGIDKGEGEIFRSFDFVRFSDRVGLRPLERLVLASSLVGASRKELATQAVHVIRTEWENAVLALCQHPSFDHADLTPQQVAKLLSNLLVDIPPEYAIIDGQNRQALILAAQTKYGREVITPILQKILGNMSLPPGMSLAQAFSDLGPEVTSDPDVIRSILGRFGINDANPPTDVQVVELISTLSVLAAEGQPICDIGALVRGLCTFGVALNWPMVMKSFDRDRHIIDTATLKVLIAILLNAPTDQEPHAVYGFWMTWANPLYQLRLLDALLSLPSDAFNFVSLPGRRIVSLDDVAGASPTIKTLAANVQSHTWNSLDLFEVLVRLGGSEQVELRNCVREMLDKAVKISAEIVHIGLLQVKQEPWNDIRIEYSQKLLNMFLAGHPNHQLVFMRIWQIQPTYLTDAFRNFYEENPLNITRILDVAQDLKILDALLEVRPFEFALDVAALASRREYLNLDKWLADNVSNHGTEFLHSVIVFLDQKMDSEKIARLSDPQQENRNMPLNPQTVTLFLRILRTNSPMIQDTPDMDYCIEVRNACLQIHPRLMSLIPGSEAEPGFTVVTYSSDIESEVDNVYKQMYEEKISIEEVIQMLQRNKESTNPRDHEIFSCMLHFLFDEYRFFQAFYPPRELAMTGYLFGSLIQYQLVDYIPLGIAIRYVVDALNCAPQTNLFKFGLQALERFEARLPEWQPLCHALLAVPHLMEARPELAGIIQRSLIVGAEMESVPSADPLPIFSAIQPDPPSAAENEEPAEEVSDRMLFIVNNLAPSNFESKVEEMREKYKDEYANWFGNYLVDQRISTEPNNHLLYLRFLDALDTRPLMKSVLHETLTKSANLLNSETTMQSSMEKNVLKNLGAWLGQLTLARNRPIKHKNLSVKDLLIEGHDNGRLPLVIPFVCKILEASTKSKVFRPPNPWLMAVVCLLAELYQHADLKLNPKFEIEVLYKSLGIEINDVEPTRLIRDRPSTNAMAMGAPLPQYLLEGDGGQPSTTAYGGTSVGPPAETPLLGALATGSADTQRTLGMQLDALLSTLSTHVVINPQLAQYNANPNFKHAVQIALDRSVREIILPVVERSVTIASISTRELVTKDFATEQNEEKLRKSAHGMAQKLAGSLALVTCKEPLKSNLTSHIRTFLDEYGFTEQSVPEQVVLMLVQENIDLACQAIEKAAMDRAVADVDANFATSYEARRRHTRERPNVMFWDPEAPQSAFASTLPDPLRTRPTGVQPHQLRVYEDFGNDPRRRFTSRPSSAVSYTRSDVPASAYGSSPGLREPPVASTTYLSQQEVMDRFHVLASELEAIIVQTPTQSIQALPLQHEIRTYVRQISKLPYESADRQRTPLSMSQKIVQLLYKTPSQLGRDIYAILLGQLCRDFDNVAHEAIEWLIHAEDERKFNIPVVLTVLRSGLISVAEQDQALAKFLLSDPRSSLQDFAAGLIRECLSGDPPVANRSQFTFTLDVLTHFQQNNKVNEAVAELLDDLRGVRRPTVPETVDIPRSASAMSEQEQLHEKLLVFFQQWVNIFQRSPTPEKHFVPFVQQLTKTGILKADDLSSFFFRVCAESSVQSYMKSVQERQYEVAFQPLDAMSRLLMYMIKYHGDASGANNVHAKVHYLTKVLSIFVLVLANMHEELGPHFHQKPFFRFFSSLVNDLHSMESQLGSAYFHLLIAISDTFSSLQPMYFPGFAFSWMSLISHRLFMPKLLLSENREGWSAFHKLLISLFKFLSPFLKEDELGSASRDLYRGSLRLLLVLLHDFPEFLSEYYFTLCDVIPPRCIQMRNIILSAYPPNLPLPDPHLSSLTYESMADMGPIPPILSDFASGLKNGDLRAYLDQFLLGRGNQTFLASLQERLKLTSPPLDGSVETYNVPLLNALVMYTGVSSVATAKTRNGKPALIPSDPGVLLFQYLATNLDLEGQFHLLSSIVVHLRYPNAHTYWYSSLLLHLFQDSKEDRFKEMVSRVLLERIIVHRPHPWGSLVTFIELLRNPKYDFWSNQFIHVSQDVSMLFEQVRRNFSMLFSS